jgi:hypothetical protein
MGSEPRGFSFALASIFALQRDPSSPPFPVLDSRTKCGDADRLFVLLPQGFDEFMNVVIDEAAEVYVKESKPRRELGT